MIHTFKYYLHDDYNSKERADYIKSQIPSLTLSDDEFSELIGRPFYEVELLCELNDVTGEVKIVSVS